MNNSIEDFLTITNNGLDVDANNIEVNCITSKNNTFSMDTAGNLICNSITTNTGSGINFDQIYPVGSIYMSVLNVNPATMFGGTWESIGGKFLIGANSTYTAGSTGGATTHNHTSAAHSHTSAAHTHGYGSLYTAINFAGSSGTYYKTKGSVSYSINEKKNDTGSGSTTSGNKNEGIQIYGSTGSTTPNNTGTTTPNNTGNSSSLPPYLSVYIWKRVS